MQLKPMLDEIAAVSDKREHPGLLAALHQRGVDAFLGITSEQNFENATMVIAFAAQGGLGLLLRLRVVCEVLVAVRGVPRLVA